MLLGQGRPPKGAATTRAFPITFIASAMVPGIAFPIGERARHPGMKWTYRAMSAIPAETFTSDDVLARLRSVLHETFEIDPAKVTPEANLFTDLELDSIDAIDLAIQVQDMTGTRIKPEDFKSVRTVGDVVATVQALLAR